MKSRDEILQRIARYLMLHGSFINNTGLLNGKTGIAIFFYHYARYTGKKLYDAFAGELMDEIVEKTVSGLKVPVRILKGKRQVDIKCLAEKISCLFGNPAYAKELGENGRKRFLEKYELTIFKEKMTNLYNHI